MGVPTTTTTGLASTSSNECSYWGFVFGPEARTAMKMTPVPDKSGRTTKWNQYDLTITAPVSAKTPKGLQAIVEDARKRLNKTGGVLKYKGRETGDFEINTSRVKDVNHGPKPGPLDIRMHGSGIAATLVFQVTTCLPDCVTASFSDKVVEFVWRPTYDVDASGYTSRTISGSLRIANNRTSPADRFSADSADEYRDKLEAIFPLEYGFDRLARQFTLSEDRSELAFTFTDKEFEGNFPPPSCVKASFRHEIGNPTAGKMCEQAGTFTGTYELHRAGKPDDMAHAFLSACVDRFNHHLSKIGPGGGDVVVLSFRQSENEAHAARSASYTLQYKYTLDSIRLEQMLSAGGLFRPLPDSKWLGWYVSMGDAKGVRGYAGLEFDLGIDRITDACDPSDLTGAGASLQSSPSDTTTINYRKYPLRQPSPATSWLALENEITVESDSGTVIYRSLPRLDPRPEDNPPVPDPVNSSYSELLRAVPPGNWSNSENGPGGQLIGAAATASTQGGYAGPARAIPEGLQAVNPVAGTTGQSNGNGLRLIDGMPSSPVADVKWQQQAAPLMYVRVRGKAMRAKFPPVKPELKSFGGAKVVAANRLGSEGFKVQVWGSSAGNVPIYLAAWSLRYAVTSYPTGAMPLAKNPVAYPAGK